MLEPTEPTQGSEELNTPSDTLPPRRRRRAASRPAGPPVAASEAPAEITSASAAPAEATALAEPADGGAAGAVDAEPEAQP
ncbi:hypothetical protein, partial [Streptomyces sp. NPDC056160]|uniref:hypothetical protein n=1 Tax=Streptomyces sp. NPDC056160 TaxID=3345731 RepID=UPI0035E30AD7